MKRFPVVRTLEQFCEATGWPREEFGSLFYSEVIGILSLYDLTLDFEFRPKCPTGNDSRTCDLCRMFAEGSGY